MAWPMQNMYRTTSVSAGFCYARKKASKRDATPSEPNEIGPTAHLSLRLQILNDFSVHNMVLHPPNRHARPISIVRLIANNNSQHIIWACEAIMVWRHFLFVKRIIFEIDKTMNTGKSDLGYDIIFRVIDKLPVSNLRKQ